METYNYGNVEKDRSRQFLYRLFLWLSMASMGSIHFSVPFVAACTGRIRHSAYQNGLLLFTVRPMEDWFSVHCIQSELLGAELLKCGHSRHGIGRIQHPVRPGRRYMVLVQRCRRAADLLVGASTPFQNRVQCSFAVR